MIHSSGKVARLSDFDQHDEKDDDREVCYHSYSDNKVMVTMVI